MRNTRVLKLANNVQKPVHLRELVNHHPGQSRPTGTAVQPRDVGIGNFSPHDLLWVVDVAKLIHPGIRHIHHGSVHFHLTGGHVGSDVGSGEGFIKSGFAGLRQSDDSKLHGDSK